ncbi:MAG TPA: ribonuclease H [Acidimicrobiales bacterium]|nr:ribonuclease H [Acidimicrobiales bacterium]
MSRTEVYTDGACQGNPGPGGWAWAVRGGRWASGAAAHTTNQRMEVQAVLAAVTTLTGPLEVVSDSTYVVNCFRDRWWEGWLRKGWVNSQKKPVANRDLWEPLIDAYRADPTRISFRWVKGHSGDTMNDVVDRLAVAAAASQQPAAGDGPPSHLGPADAPRRSSPVAPAPTGDATTAATTGAAATATAATGAGTAELPGGHRIVVTGVRPPALGGYDDPPAAAEVRAQLTRILAAKAQLHPSALVVTGLGLGAEQLAAEAATAAGVPYAAVLAYPGTDSPWPPASRERFAALTSGAAATLVLQTAAPASRQAAGTALARRDAWVARHADEAIVVFDGRDPAVGRTLRSLRDHLGEEQVWVLDVPDQALG